MSNYSIVGHPIAVSCAYSGRLAVAYRLLGPKVLPHNPKGKLLNMWVAIYECESTGEGTFFDVRYSIASGFFSICFSSLLKF